MKYRILTLLTRDKSSSYIISLIYLCSVFHVIFIIPFAFHNDYFVWSYKAHKLLSSFPESVHLIKLGRALGAYFLNIHFLFLDSLRDMAVSRGFSILVTVVSVSLFAGWLRRFQLGSLVALMISLSVFVLPGHQLYVIWLANFVPGTLNVLIALISALLIDHVDLDRLLRFKLPPPSQLIYLLLGVGLFTVSLFIYPPTTLFYLVPTFARLLFTPLKDWDETRKKFIFDLVFCSAISFVYYVIISATLGAYRIGSYELKVTQDFSGKFNYFVQDISHMAFNLWNTPPTWNVFYVVISFIALICCFTAAQRFYHSRQCIVPVLEISGAVVLLIVFVNLPALVASGNMLGYRIFVPYASMAALLFFWALISLANVFPYKFQGLLSRFLILATLSGATWAAYGNIKNAAVNANMELNFVRDKLKPYIHSGDTSPITVWVIIPWNHRTFTNKPLAYDFAFMATTYSLIGGIFDLVVGELADKPRRVYVFRVNKQITDQARLENGDVVLVDMNELVPPSDRQSSPLYDDKKLTGLPSDFWNLEGPWLPMVRAGYHGYNIFYAERRFFATSARESPFDVKKFWNDEYTRALTSPSYDEIIHRIDVQFLSNEPILIEDNYYEFDIMTFSGAYYGIARSEKNETISERLRQCANLRCVTGRSVDEIKNHVKNIISRESPVTIEKGYKEYNIIQFMDLYYGLAQEEGDFSAEKLNKKRYVRIVRGSSIEEVKRKIEEPILVAEGYRGFNIIYYRGTYYGLAQEEGAFDLKKFDENICKRCLTAETARKIKRRIKEYYYCRA